MNPVADPGFPRGGGANPKGAQTYYLANFSRKLHENKEILGRGGARGTRQFEPVNVNLLFGTWQLQKRRTIG